MITTINSSLQKAGLNFQKFDEQQRTVFKFGMGLENGKTDVIIDVRENANLLLIYVTGTINVPENKRVQMAEFLAKANYGLIIGNFELDFSDGEIRYKCSYAFDDTFPDSEKVLMRNFIAAINTFDKYLPGIMVLIYGRVTPQDAIAQVENRTNPASN